MGLSPQSSLLRVDPAVGVHTSRSQTGLVAGGYGYSLDVWTRTSADDCVRLLMVQNGVRNGNRWGS